MFGWVKQKEINKNEMKKDYSKRETKENTLEKKKY